MGFYTAPLEAYVKEIDKALPHYLPKENPTEQPVGRAMHYACEDGGKRLRPVLVLEWCRLCGGDVAKALPFACALEMIHAYSLVHDDLPCMDNSPLRRGKPSTHAAFGETMALLAGDALLNRAFETALSPQNTANLPADAVLKAVYAMADAAGIHGMVGGQVMDLNSEGGTLTLEELQQLQHGKTARLIMAACEMGAHLAGADAETCERALTYGRELGLCFQIVDDILDVTADAAVLGKPIGGDTENSKVTYVSLLGLAAAKALAKERTDRAVAALASFGDEAASLIHLATAMLERDR